MKFPDGDWLILKEADSTQEVAKDLAGRGDSIPVVFARHQTRGRGRFDRDWLSVEGESLTFSIIFSNYANHPHPYLIAMNCAAAAARSIGGKVRWPNDLAIDHRKVGGVLTEIVVPHGKRVPIVGIGINLNQRTFPDFLADKATSVQMTKRCEPLIPIDVANRIQKEIESSPEPKDWSCIRDYWHAVDDTPGKLYRLMDGRSATAKAVTDEGALLCEVSSEEIVVLAADALFGPGS